MLGLPLLQVEGVEADDVIGTLAREAEAAGMNCVISTGDKDMAQLVSGKTTLTNTMTDTDMDRNGVKEKFDVTPEQIVDFLALTGDKSDNIPGVEKCGPKTAAKWLAQWGSLDEVIEHADEVGGKIGENLRAALEQLPLSRELATIRRDLDLDFQPTGTAAWRNRQGTADRSAETLRVQQLAEGTGPGRCGRAGRARTTRPSPRLSNWIACWRELEKARLIAFDTETTSLDSMQARPGWPELLYRRGAGVLYPGRTRLRRGTAATGPRRGACKAQAFAGRPAAAKSRPTHQVRHECAVNTWRHGPGGRF